MKRIFITGIAGTGKSTLARILRERGLNTVDVDHVPDLCSWVNTKTGEKVFAQNPDNDFIDKHDYVCDMAKLEKMMDEFQDHIFVFGSVGDNRDFIPLFDETILLQCEPETLINRLQKRDTNPFGKEKEVQNRMLKWKKKFDELMLDAGAVPVSTEADPETVADEVSTLVS